MLKLFMKAPVTDQKAMNIKTGFRSNMKSEWFNDKFTEDMIMGIEGTKHIKDFYFESKLLGAIPPDYLSGTVKFLIMCKQYPDVIFPLTHCGDNATSWLNKLSQLQDISVTHAGSLFKFEDSQVVQLMDIEDHPKLQACNLLNYFEERDMDDVFYAPLYYGS